MSTNAERSSHLLNLLKFSVQNSAAQQQSQPQSPQQPHHAPNSWQMYGNQQVGLPQQQQQQPLPQHHLHHLQHQASSGQFHAGHHGGYQPSMLSQSYKPSEQQQQQQQQAQGPGGADGHDDTDTEVEVADVPAPKIHQPAPVPADPSGLLAALMRGAREVDTPKLRSEPDTAATVPASSFSTGFTTASPGPNPDTRAYLLNLLNRPKPTQSQSQSEGGQGRAIPGQDDLTPQQTSLPSSYTSQAHMQAHGPVHGPVHGPHQQQPLPQPHQHQHQHQQNDSHFYDYQRALQDSAQSGYSYGSGSQKSYPVNAEPSDYTSVGQATSVRAASNEPSAAYHHIQKPSPMAREVRTQAPSPVSKDSPILGHADGHARTVANSPAQVASNSSPRKVDGDANNKPPRKTAAQALESMAESVHKEAQETLARAEQDVAMRNIANDLESMLAAQTERELAASAQAAAKAVQQELDGDGDESLLETALKPAVANQVRDLVDEAASYGPPAVADSWEAEHDNDAAAESENKENVAPAHVRVYEFPMRPWISITLVAGGTEPRPHFGEKSVLAVAKLKKEFDQLDRNLYTATQRFMTYGMSKAGGMRVIHQEDGLDKKVFTETGDRIFHVAMPVTRGDAPGRRREAVIGTGLSGTVYWVELADGDKNFLQDAHLEQHGFALPPIAGENEQVTSPDHVLKTRVRASNGHPEFFGAARGKWIHIVWPYLILQKSLLRPGHDRVVDSDALAARCSLRINTGKSGKDFIFSQDDSVVVSLDKPGRVKFWDVRDLTACQPDDALQPRHTAMDLADPVLTLSTVPEGEKGSPTSVLLLDKLKPYQKRTALRYMVVGLRQNHSLQLWDLALGKPVQELHLPHERDDDALCSIMYHPTTGMIVIGHPTRNSVYFAHLSAPKYNLRPLSQAEYMHMLVTGDPSLPMPDSTAVISGVREYSLANLGDLRSLDILSTPAVQQDSDEPTLFELYAMHSRGVACILVRQSDLGWARDNAVLAPVNALDVGAIEVDKLESLQAAAAASPAKQSPPQPQQPQSQAQQQQQQQPFRIATRPAPRDAQLDSPSRRSQELPPSKNNNRDSGIASPERFSLVDSKKPPQHPQQQQRKKKTADAGSNRGGIDSARATPVIADPGKQEVARPAAAAAADTSSASPQAVHQALEPLLASFETRLTAQISDSLASSLRGMQTKLEESNNGRDKEFKLHQSRLLNSVSDTLSNNTQSVLQAIVREEFAQSIVPAISEGADKSISQKLGPQLAQVSSSVRDEIENVVPEAVHRAIQVLDLPGRISERVGRAITSKLTEEIVPHLSQVVSDVTVSACQHVLNQSSQQSHEQLEKLLTAARRADAQKIEQLSGAVSRLTETVMAMASSQAQFQDQFLRLQQQQQQQQHSHAQQPHAQNHHYLHSSPPQPRTGAERQMAANSSSLVLHERFGQQQQQQQSEYDYQSPTTHGHPHAAHLQGGGGGQQQQPQQHLHHHSPQMGPMGPGPHHMAAHIASSLGQDGVTSPASNASTQAALSRANAYIARQAHSHGVARSDRPLDQVKAYFEAHQYEKALLAWVQSGTEDQMFDHLLYTYSPDFMREATLPPLVLMSVAATVSQSLKGAHLAERVIWMDLTLQALHRVLSRGTSDEQVVRVTPKVMGLVRERIQKLYADVSRRSPGDQALPPLARMLEMTETIVEVNDNAFVPARPSYMG
jgi:hypothetical protein